MYYPDPKPTANETVSETIDALHGADLGTQSTIDLARANVTLELVAEHQDPRWLPLLAAVARELLSRPSAERRAATRTARAERWLV